MQIFLRYVFHFFKDYCDLIAEFENIFSVI